MPSWPHRSNDRYLIVGLTQSGKSTLTRAIVEQWSYTGGPHGLSLVVCDPKADDQLQEWFGPATDFPPAEWQAVHHWVPMVGDDDALDRGLRAVFARGNCVLWVDELGLVASSGSWPWGLAACYQQGARRHVGVIGLTQDPVRIPVFCRSQAEHKVVFRVQHPSYLDELSRACNCDMSAAATLPPHHSLLASLRLDPSVPQPVHMNPLEV